MKRKVSILLVLAIMLSMIPLGAFAGNYDKQLEEAIIRCKKLFNIGNEYDNFDQSIRTSDGTTMFYLNWWDSKEKLDSINVSIAEDGTVINYSRWKQAYKEEGHKLPSISKEEGLQIAMDFIKKVAPKILDNIEYKDVSEPLSVHSNDYNYYFIRKEKGIPYYNNTIGISIDRSTGEIWNYYSDWDVNLKFSELKDIIPLEDVKELYKEKIGLDLIYKTNYREQDSNIFLVYGPKYSNLGINAKNGEIVALNDYFFMNEKAADMAAGGAIEKQSLSPYEEKALGEVADIIPQKEAEKIGREILQLGKEYELNSVSLYKNFRSDDSYNWQLEFRKILDSRTYYASISIDAKTKEIISFYMFGPEDASKKIKYNKEQSLEIAKEYIKKMIPDRYEFFEYRENYVGYRPLEEQRNYGFSFVRKLDKACVEQDGITVSVDTTTGKIIEYRITWSDREFPSQDEVIPIEKAYDILFDEIELELKYIYVDRYEETNKDKREAILAYGLKANKPAIIDANNGIVLNSSGEPYKEASIISYNDIEDSYAKEKIGLLAQYGIALPGDTFRPKEKIVQKDFLYLLAKANNPYVDIDKSTDKLYTYLINSGIIKEEEKAPERVVTKEESVKYIIRALGHEEIANINEIFKDIFKDTKDISKELKGYVAIAYGLKIIQGSDGYLYPKAELSREDGASIIYNYLFNGK